MMNKKLVIALVPILVVIIALLSVLGFLLVSETDNVYLEQMKTAQKYVNDGDYERAILHYRNAINEDNTQEDPYLLLAQLYYNNLNDIDNAIATLEEGYRNTNSTKIYETLISYQSLLDLPVTDKDISENIGSINRTLVDMFASYTYQTYTEKMTLKNEKKTSGVYTVSYAQYNIDFEYSNSTDNVILDTNTGKPLSYARPTSIKINDLNILISGVDQGVSIDDLKANGISGIKQNNSNATVGSEYITFEYSGCSFTIACDSDGVILSVDCYNNIVPPKGEASVEKVTVSGKIIDVTTAQKAPNTKVVFRKGSDVKTGEEADLYNSSNGDYSVEVEPGNYTVEVSGEDYTTEYFNISVPQTSTFVQDFSVSPVLSARQIRIVLEWDAMPEDLDSHLDGTTGSGQSVNIDFTSRTAGDIANLDVDDTNGYGPETITLNDTSGTYEYRVHKYSRSGSLASSGATVKVYTGDSSQPIVISVPSDISGDWWDVFRIENGRIVDISGVTN